MRGAGETLSRVANMRSHPPTPFRLPPPLRPLLPLNPHRFFFFFPPLILLPHSLPLNTSTSLPSPPPHPLLSS